MEVRPGYKQTEVGVIPEEWEVKSLGHLIKLQAGYSFRSENFSDIGTPVIRISDIQDGIVSTDSAVCHPPFKIDDDFVVKNGDFLVAMSGATTGKVGVFHSPKPAYQNQRVGRFVVRDESRTSKLFVGQLVRSSRFGSRLSVLLEQGAQPNVSGRQIESLLFPVPNQLPEQRAIATALSDVDGLLGGLDRLIAKKRDLKQAAMQQLLTGQTRLPGWDGAWEVKKLKQVAEISTGINKPLSEMGSGALYVTVQDLYDKTSIRTERLSRIKVSPSEIETRGLMVGDIVFGKSSVKRDGIGYPSQFLGCDEPVVFSGFTYRARARQGITDPTFLFYTLREEKTRRWLIDNSQASALTNINQTIADAIPVQVPPSVPEQTAIASVLSEMDGELAMLEQRRDKTRALKQAMMQELLTGRTRLV